MPGALVAIPAAASELEGVGSRELGGAGRGVAVCAPGGLAGSCGRPNVLARLNGQYAVQLPREAANFPTPH